MWLFVGKHLASVNREERGGHPQTQLVMLLVYCSLPAEEEDLLQCLEKGFERRDYICFCFLGLACWFLLLGKGAALVLVWVSCLSFPLETGAVKRDWLSALNLDSEVGWRRFQGPFRKSTGWQLHCIIQWDFSKKFMPCKAFCSVLIAWAAADWDLTRTVVVIRSLSGLCLAGPLTLLLKPLYGVAGQFNN